MALHQATRLDSPDKCFSSSNKCGSKVVTVEPAMQTKASKAMLQPWKVLKVLHVGCCTIKSCLQTPLSSAPGGRGHKCSNVEAKPEHNGFPQG